MCGGANGRSFLGGSGTWRWPSPIESQRRERIGIVPSAGWRRPGNTLGSCAKPRRHGRALRGLSPAPAARCTGPRFRPPARAGARLGGRGHEALVRHLDGRGVEVQGIDRAAEDRPRLKAADWFDEPLGMNRWGTILSVSSYAPSLPFMETLLPSQRYLARYSRDSGVPPADAAVARAARVTRRERGRRFTLPAAPFRRGRGPRRRRGAAHGPAAGLHTSSPTFSSTRPDPGLRTRWFAWIRFRRRSSNP